MLKCCDAKICGMQHRILCPNLRKNPISCYNNIIRFARSDWFLEVRTHSVRKQTSTDNQRFDDKRSEGNMDRATPLEKCPALILNADFRPLSYFPLSVWPWQEAVKAIFRGSVNVVSEYERTVRSPHFEIKLPSVLALKEYVPIARSPAFTRFNVFLRDRWDCQYCGDHFKTHELTFDHVIPRSRGGRTNWENIVAACQSCNTVKGSKMRVRV